MKKLKIILPISILAFGLFLFLILFFNIPRLSYTYSKDYDAYYVSKVYGNASKYVIPDTYKNKEVIGIGTRAFYKKNNVKYIILGENVIYIDRLAFSECSKLETINLDKVDTIYRNAFSYCKKLDNITLSATNIGASAFYKCDSLNIVNLKEGVESIGSMAFADTKIQKISIPKSVFDVGNDCFYDCFALNSVKVYSHYLTNDSKKYLNSLAVVSWVGVDYE